MYDRILVPLDGSELAEEALEHGETLARLFGGELVLLRALPILTPVLTLPDQVGPADLNMLNSAEREESRAYLETIAARLAAGGVNVRTAVLDGDPAGVILAAAGEDEADLVVMSSHGRSGLSRWIYGSVAEKVVGHAPCPVMVVRQGTAHPAG